MFSLCHADRERSIIFIPRKQREYWKKKLREFGLNKKNRTFAFSFFHQKQVTWQLNARSFNVNSFSAVLLLLHTFCTDEHNLYFFQISAHNRKVYLFFHSQIDIHDNRKTIVHTNSLLFKSTFICWWSGKKI